MSLLIDGYNLLHVTGIFGRGSQEGSLKRSRQALLNFLATSLPADQLATTTIVFDAQNAPPGLPRAIQHGGMSVRYAAEYPDADSLIEELIQAEHVPRRLTVVSSDHRIQRAARRRRAMTVDSHQWYVRLIQLRRLAQTPDSASDVKPQLPLCKADVEAWLNEFANIDVDQLRKEVTPERTSHPKTGDKGLPRAEADRNLDNPFPPGYAEDLLDDEPP